jgi:DNA topoisomerase IB
VVICKRQGAVHAVASNTVSMRNGAGWGDCAKCDRMVAFGEALSKLRRKLKRDLALSGLPREKMPAVVVGLLDATRVRIGIPNTHATTQVFLLRRFSTDTSASSVTAGRS